MATLSAPLLNPTAPEDTMELSSPGNRPLDEDIDIDFDGEYGAATIHDEQMGDDGDHDTVEQDEDMLQFEEHHDSAPTADPAFSTTADEDLIDYSDEEDVAEIATASQPQPFAADLHVASPADSALSAVKPEDTHVQLAGRSDFPEPAIVVTDQQQLAATATTTATAAEGSFVKTAPTASDIPSDVGADKVDLPQSTSEATAPSQPILPPPEQSSETALITNEPLERFEADEPVERRENDKPDNALQEPEQGVLKPRLSTTSLVPPTEGPGTPTDTGLHPVVLYFDDHEYPLFRSRSSSEGLLKDDNLVSVSLADLIKACRQSFVIKTRREIDDNLELIFTFDDLSLSIYEDAPAAFQTSLQEVLDVYLQLQSNDGHGRQQTPPLSISCSLHVKFNNSIVVLKNAAERGEGLTAVIPAYGEEEHEDESYHDQVTDDHEHIPELEGQYEEDPEDDAEHANREEPETVEEEEEAEQWNDEHDAEEGDHYEEQHEHDTFEEQDVGEAAQEHETDEVPGFITEHDITSVQDDQTHLGTDAAQDAAESSEDASTTLPALSGSATPVNDADAVELADPDRTDPDEDEDNTHDENADQAVHEAAPQDDAYLHPGDSTEQDLDHDYNAEDITPFGDAAPTTPAEDQLDPTSLHAEAHTEAAASEFELDLEDYDRPESIATTSPSIKRHRNTDDDDDTTNDNTKKLRSS